MASASTPAIRYAWLAIGAAVVTIILKFTAYRITGSVGLLSDALESGVNLVAAVAALVALWIASKEPDDEHAYGHGKAEYFSSGLEGTLIVVAAGLIVWSAIPRLFEPVPLENAGAGVLVSVLAAAVNLVVALVLLRGSRQQRSITLEASGRHLLTDVWTSVGVVVAIGAIALTGWNRLDPVIALLVAANILWTGYGLIDRSIHGLLDTAIPDDDIAVVKDILARHERPGEVQMHALRTRQAASRRFVSFHVMVTSNWSVRRGHRLLEQIEREIRAELPNTTVFTHLEPIDDPASWADGGLDGTGTAQPGAEPPAPSATAGHEDGQEQDIDHDHASFDATPDAPPAPERRSRRAAVAGGLRRPHLSGR